MLVPAPDYPLWTATTSLAGGTPVHYLCREEEGWLPDLDDIRAKITPRTKAIVVINPNNPTGAVYPERVLEQIADVARRYRVAYQIEKPKAGDTENYEVAHGRGVYIFDPSGRARLLASDANSVQAITDGVKSLLK